MAKTTKELPDIITLCLVLTEFKALVESLEKEEEAELKKLAKSVMVSEEARFIINGLEKLKEIAQELIERFKNQGSDEFTERRFRDFMYAIADFKRLGASNHTLIYNHYYNIPVHITQERVYKYSNRLNKLLDDNNIDLATVKKINSLKAQVETKGIKTKTEVIELYVNNKKGNSNTKIKINCVSNEKYLLHLNSNSTLEVTCN